MRIAIKDDIRLAITTMRRSKWRTGLTMLGVIIGVCSVILVVGIGEGARQQIADQARYLDDKTLLIRPQDPSEAATNLARDQISGSLQAGDVAMLDKLASVGKIAPLALVRAPISVDGKTQQVTVFSTTADLPELFHKKIADGDFFKPGDIDSTVLGEQASQRLFNQKAPLGKAFTLLGKQFIIYGIFEPQAPTPFAATMNFNNAVFVPYDQLQDLTNKSVQPFEILVQAKDGVSLNQLKKEVTASLLTAHGGQQDFQVFDSKDITATTDETLNMLTLAIAGIAIISLVVGGIGIMNVMLVSVTERMHEIGIRKAVGATNHQILRQFLTESMVVSLIGGVIGAFVAIVSLALLGLYTDLEPVLVWPVVGLAIGVTLLVGMVFGTIPAMKAARKDPIEALRHE